MDRRQAMTAMGAMTAAATGAFAGSAQGAHHDHGGAHVGAAMVGTLAAGYDPQKGEYVLPPLPYDYDALEPHIDAQTMRIHHDRHHQGYVNGLNGTLKKLESARAEGDFAMIRALSRDLSFHGGGHALHTLFWTNMAPKGHGGEPAGPLLKAIERDFGSVDAMKEHFHAAASSVRGSGWGILGKHLMSGQLVIIQGEDQHKLTPWAFNPLMVVDVWEHAYYLKYQNRRGEYVKNFLDVVNWDEVARRFSWHAEA